MGCVIGLLTFELTLQFASWYLWSEGRTRLASSDAGHVALCVGDSFTYGAGASDGDKAYPAQAQRLLAARGHADWDPDSSTFNYNLDLAVSPDGRFLYNVLPGPGKIAGFEVDGWDGSLDSIGRFEGLDSSPPVNDPAAQPPGELLPLNNDGGSPAGAIAVDFGGDDDDDDDDD